MVKFKVVKNKQEQLAEQSQDKIGGKGRFGLLPYSQKLQALKQMIDVVKTLKQEYGDNIEILGQKESTKQYNSFLKRVQDIFNADPDKNLSDITDEVAQEVAIKVAEKHVKLEKPKATDKTKVKSKAPDQAKPAVTPTSVSPAATPKAKKQSEFIKGLNDIKNRFRLSRKVRDEAEILNGLVNLRKDLERVSGKRLTEEEQNPKQKFTKKFVDTEVKKYLDSLPAKFKDNDAFRKAVMDLFTGLYFPEKQSTPAVKPLQPAADAKPDIKPILDPKTKEELLKTINDLLTGSEVGSVGGERQAVYQSKLFDKNSKIGKLFSTYAFALGLRPDEYMTKSGMYDQKVKIQPHKGIEGGVGQKHREVLEKIKSDLESGQLKESLIYEGLFDKFLNNSNITNKKQLFKLGNDGFKKYNRG